MYSNIINYKEQSKYFDKNCTLSYSIFINIETNLLLDICNIINEYLPKCCICNESKKIIYYYKPKNITICSTCIQYSGRKCTYSVDTHGKLISKFVDKIDNTLYCLICKTKILKKYYIGHINKCQSHIGRTQKIKEQKREHYYKKFLDLYDQIISNKNSICGCGQICDIQTENDLEQELETKKHKNIVDIYDFFDTYHVNDNFDTLIKYIDNNKQIDNDIFIEFDDNYSLELYCLSKYTEYKKQNFFDMLKKFLKLSSYISIKYIVQHTIKKY